ncbi:hypothetical protein D3C75_940120 [compost metagenome]
MGQALRVLKAVKARSMHCAVLAKACTLISASGFAPWSAISSITTRPLLDSERNSRCSLRNNARK